MQSGGTLSEPSGQIAGVTGVCAVVAGGGATATTSATMSETSMSGYLHDECRPKVDEPRYADRIKFD